jgi:hypothetical protein
VPRVIGLRRSDQVSLLSLSPGGIEACLNRSVWVRLGREGILVFRSDGRVQFIYDTFSIDRDSWVWEPEEGSRCVIEA